MSKLVEIVCMHKEICDRDKEKIKNGDDIITYPLHHPCHKCNGYEYQCDIYQDYIQMVQEKMFKLD